MFSENDCVASPGPNTYLQNNTFKKVDNDTPLQHIIVIYMEGAEKISRCTVENMIKSSNVVVFAVLRSAGSWSGGEPE